MIYPADGEMNVPVDSEISWTNPGSVTGFIVSIGTVAGGVDILTNRTSSPITSYTHEVGLPEDTWIYISFVLTQLDGTDIICPGFRFRTEPFDRPPDCTQLAAPLDGSTEVGLGSEVRWEYAQRATGYFVTMVTSDGVVLVDNLNVGNVLAYNPPGVFPANTEIEVTVRPYNRLAPAGVDCPPERFSTGASNVNCNEHLPPEAFFPAEVGLCPDRDFTEFSAPPGADGYNWYRLESNGDETLLGGGMVIALDQPGNYRLESYNDVGSINEYTRCPIIRDFRVVEGRLPEIRNVDIRREPDGLRIEIQMARSGNYEYSLSPDSGFQNSPVFAGLPLQGYTVYVRDLFGCGMVERDVTRNLSAADFPRFFTPNSDGFNDLWKYEPPEDLSGALVETIRIFDRYGNFLVQLDSDSHGWDGNFNGQPLPSSVYWFEAISIQREVIRGYFALKR